MTLSPCRWVQQELGIPPGRLTEGTIECGHKMVKLLKTSFSRCLSNLHLLHLHLHLHPLARNHSYKAENFDILTGCSWRSDPLVLWEGAIGQKYRHGNIRRSSADMELAPLAMVEEEGEKGVEGNVEEEENAEEEME